ncbi:MAG: hypothetical protein EBS01_08815 [Verrucomicrobia bacterium]|nr:hypothetical protein [Verrucomicrobiota bacterium]
MQETECPTVLGAPGFENYSVVGGDAERGRTEPFTHLNASRIPPSDSQSAHWRGSAHRPAEDFYHKRDTGEGPAPMALS